MKPVKGLRFEDVVTGDGSTARVGDIAHVGCTCRLPRGEILFTTEGDAPYQVRLGARDCAVGLEHGILGMKVGGVRHVRVAPQLTHIERKIYPDLSDRTALQYEIRLLSLPDRWDNTLHIRTSQVYSEQTRELERRYRELEPSSDLGSEFQRVQSELFTRAAAEYKRHQG